MSGMCTQCAPRSNGTPKVRVSVTHRPPTRSLASISAKRRPAAATLRAAAMPAAPAPTIATSVSPEADTAPSAGADASAAETAMKFRRLRVMVSRLFPCAATLPERRGLRKRPARSCAFVHRLHEPKRNAFPITCRVTKDGENSARVLRGNAMGRVLDRFGQMIARYLERPVSGYEPFTPSDPSALSASLRPGDVLLVEGNNHISGVIKYLTQSTWSHAALYVGPLGERTSADGEPLVLVEAVLGQGVVGAPLSKYKKYHARICRPIGLTEDDRARVCAYAAERIGFDYDLKNITDLLRYLLPLPVPQRWRRRMMSLGSGD